MPSPAVLRSLEDLPPAIRALARLLDDQVEEPQGRDGDDDGCDDG